jgi:hypothetical protein
MAASVSTTMSVAGDAARDLLGLRPFPHDLLAAVIVFLADSANHLHVPRFANATVFPGELDRGYADLFAIDAKTTLFVRFNLAIGAANAARTMMV